MVSIKSAAPRHPNLQVTKLEGLPVRLKTIYHFTGISHSRVYSAYTNSLDTIERAIKERVFFVIKDGQYVSPPRPEGQDYHDLMFETFSTLKKLATFTVPLTRQQYVDSAIPSKRRLYQLAADRLAVTPVRAKHAYLQSFVKTEKTLITDDKPHPVPRLIQPTSAMFIVELGRHIKSIEKKLYKCIDTMFGDGVLPKAIPTIFKGLNAEKRGDAMLSKWNLYRCPVAIMLDASRFDQHVSEPSLLEEHKVYKAFFPNDKYFAKLLHWTVDQKGFASANDGSARYKIKGMRASGHPHTALGNCTLMSSMIYQRALDTGVKMSLANDGDDCVVIMESRDLDKFMNGTEMTEWFVKLGFTMKVETPVYVFEEIDFCQSRPIRMGETALMVRDPRKSIPKDCMSFKPLNNPNVYRMWSSAVGQAGLSLTGGVPVLQNFYQTFLRAAEGARALKDPTLITGMTWQALGMDRKYTLPTPETRLSFYLAFGLTPSEQEAYEELYDASNRTYGFEETTEYLPDLWHP